MCALWAKGFKCPVSLANWCEEKEEGDSKGEGEGNSFPSPSPFESYAGLSIM